MFRREMGSKRGRHDMYVGNAKFKNFVILYRVIRSSFTILISLQTFLCWCGGGTFTGIFCHDSHEEVHTTACYVVYCKYILFHIRLSYWHG